MSPGEGSAEEPDPSRSSDRGAGDAADRSDPDVGPSTGVPPGSDHTGQQTADGPGDLKTDDGATQSMGTSISSAGRQESSMPVDRPRSITGWIWWFLTVREGWPVFVREVLSSVIAVLLVGLVLFAVSGVWPPMVAVESGSMEPHMFRGDLVFIMEEHRFAPEISHTETGVVTFEDAQGADYTRFGSYGDVIVFDSPQNAGPPIIHRARFWVDADENWYERANPEFLNGDDCASIPNCPAPNAGFITRGDANPTYDQVSGISRPVRPEWITGTAEVRVPWLGYIRLEFSELSLDSGLSAIRSAVLSSHGPLVPVTVTS